MKVKEYIKRLKGMDQEAEVLFASDEEINTLRSEGQVALLEGERAIIVYGLNGSEREL